MITKRPQSFINSILRFIPMLTLFFLALLMGCRVFMMFRQPDFDPSTAFMNASFLLDTAWLLCGAVLALVSGWSWGMRTTGESVLTPWVIKKESDSLLPVVPDLEIGLGGGLEMEEERKKERKRREAMEEKSSGPAAAVTLVFGMLTTVASLLTTLYCGAVLVFGVQSGTLTSFTLSVSLLTAVASLALVVYSMRKKRNSIVTQAMALACALFILSQLLQVLMPGVLGSSILAVHSEADLHTLSAPLKDLQSALSSSPLFVTFKDVVKEVAKIVTSPSSSFWSSFLDPVSQSGSTSVLGRIGDFFRENVTAGRVGAFAVGAIVLLNVALIVFAPPVGAAAAGATATTVAQTMAVVAAVV
jgi:hypothetical protein